MAVENYERAIAAVFAEEGGYGDHPKDKGGPTNFGITQSTLAGWRGRAVSAGDVRALTKAEAESIYRKQYAETIKFDDLPPGVDLMVLDFAVNSGPATAAKALQRAVGSAPDGVVGVKTLTAAAAVSPAVIVDRIRDERMAFLRKLGSWPTFGKGWTNRVGRIHDIATGMAHGTVGAVQRVTIVPETASALPTDIRLTATSSGQTSIVAGAAGFLGVGIEVAQLFVPHLEKLAGAEAVQYLSVTVALAAVIRNVLLERARIARGQAGV